jgi:MFS family permease
MDVTESDADQPKRRQWSSADDGAEQVEDRAQDDKSVDGLRGRVASTPATSSDSDITFEQRLKQAILDRRLAYLKNQRSQAKDSTPRTPNAPARQRAAGSSSTANKSQETLRTDSGQKPCQSTSALSSAINVSTSFPIYSKTKLAPTASAPVAGAGKHVASSRCAHATIIRTRGRRHEKASFKLNRFFESSLSMLPQPNLYRVTTTSTPKTRHSTISGKRLRHHTAEQTSAGKYKSSTHADYASTRPADEHQQMATTKGSFYSVNLRAHHLQHTHKAFGKPSSEHPSTGSNSDASSSASSHNGYDDDDDDDDDEVDVDGGYAWIILAVMFVINASTFGTARAYGMIFDKLARVDEQSRSEAALPFTVMGAIENMAGPLTGCLLARTTSSWRLTVFVGSCLVSLAHFIAALSASSQIVQLLAMGLMCGLGLSFVSISFFQLNNAYFNRYRNTAFGVSMTGAAFGTLYISPLCQYFLDNFEGTAMCYLMLGLIIAPNVPMSLLLKPKRVQANDGSAVSSRSQSIRSKQSAYSNEGQQQQQQDSLKTISETIDERDKCQQEMPSMLTRTRMVIMNPLFHLIWPTQLLFCWFNFVFGMIIVDFGKDRGLDAQDVAHLVPIWAFGQLVGRLLLSTLVDLKLLSYRSFTVICFGAISITTYILNNTRILKQCNENGDDGFQWFRFPIPIAGQHLLIFGLILVLSMFIALLYILLNGLIVNYVEEQLQPLSIGISSFTGSFFLLPRAYVIGYYRDNIGNYDSMLTMFALVSLFAALTWLIVPTSCRYLRKFHDSIRINDRTRRESIISIVAPPYSSRKLGAHRHQS